MLSTALNYGPVAVCTFGPRARSRLRSRSLSSKTDLEVDCLSLYNSNEGKSEAISITLILHEMPVNRLLETNRTSSSAAPAALGDRAPKIPAL